MATHAAASPATVLLEDGTAIAGSGFGASKAVGGEVVFNTGMSGYVEPRIFLPNFPRAIVSGR